MTREESIRHIEAAKLMLLGKDNQPISDLYYALDMAIKALEQEPCEDAISRQAAIDAIYKMHMNGKEGVLHDLKTETGSDAFFAETIADAVETLEELPSVNPQPKTGKWIDSPNGYFTHCSECGLHGDKGIYKHYGWCPKCGAKMIEPQESEDKE